MIYLGIVLFSGLLARKISGDMAGLTAMALIANAPDPALKYLIYPVWHGSTILIILIAIYAYFGLKSHIKIIALGLLAIIGVLNDTLIVPFLIAPLLVLSVYNYFKSNNKPEREESLGIIIAMVLGLMVLIVKGVGFSLWPNGLYITDVGSISGQMSASLKIDMLWQYLQSIINMSGGIVLASVLIIGIYSAWKYKANRKLILIVSMASLIMFFGFLFMTNTGGDQGRYLYLIPLLAMIAIAIGLPEKRTMASLIIPLLLVMLIITNAMAIIGQDHDLNQKDRDLIEYLHSVNVTHAYADYWASNLLTYMDASQQLKIRPITITEGKIQYLYLQSSISWTDEGWPNNASDFVDNSPVIIAYSPGDPIYAWAQSIKEEYPPIESYEYPWYGAPGCTNTTIYVYKYNSTLPSMPVESFSEFQSRGVKPV
jgi:hypothetical protein